MQYNIISKYLACMFRYIRPILFVVIILPYIIQCHKNDEATQTYTVCTSLECQNFANSLTASMNTSADPCDDFYDYVCDGWMEKHPAVNGKYINRINEWKKTVYNRVSNILKTPIHPSDSRSLEEAKNVYGMCIGQLDDTGLTDLITFIENLGGWPITVFPSNTWNANNNIQWPNIIMNIHRYYIHGPFFSMETEIKSLTRLRCIHLRTPSSDNVESERNLIKRVASVIISANNPNIDLTSVENAIDRDISDIGNFTDQLENINTWSDINAITIKEMQEKYNENNSDPQLEWLAVIRNVYDMYEINETERICVEGMDYFTNFGKLLSKTPIRTVVNYMIWFIVRKLLPFTNEHTREIHGFPKNTIDRESKCIDEPNLKHAVYYEYMKMYMPNNMKQAARFYIEDIRKELRKRVQSITWMDDLSKAAGDKTLSHTKIQIGGPEWYSDTALDTYFQDLEITPKYLESVLHILSFDVSANARLLRTPVNITETENYEWFMLTPLDTIALHDPSTDTICIPAGALSDLYFNIERPPSVNYGMLGCLIAQGIIREYDMERRIFHLGRYETHWTNESMKVYEEKARCLANQYSQFELFEGTSPSSKVNDNSTLAMMLTENIPTTGIFAAYEVYKLRTMNDTEIRLPNMENYTANQLFFISYGSLLCDSFSPDMVNTILSQRRIPGRARVRGAFSNMDEFAVAFNCSEGTRMNPLKKCKLWK